MSVESFDLSRVKADANAFATARKVNLSDKHEDELICQRKRR